MKLSVGICEDDPFTLSSLSGALLAKDVEVSFSCTSASVAIQEFRTHRPHALLLDLNLGTGPTGLDLARAVRRVAPETGIVFLTSFESPRLVEKNFLGAPAGSQYLVKQRVGSVDAILTALQLSISRNRRSSVFESETLAKLTDHQLEVLRLVAMGASNSEIATRLNLDSKSVEGVTRRISKALGIQSDQNNNQRVQMARAYLRATGANLEI